jgi:phage replication O-like protein O
MTNKIDKPNYTQVPNCLLDSMTEFTPSEFKLAMIVCRFTFGFHRRRHYMSYDFISEKTGMCRESISKALFGLIGKNVLNKQKHGETFSYSLNVESISDIECQISDESQFGIRTTTSSETELGAVRNPNSIKESIKEKKEKKEPRLSDEEFLNSLKAIYPWIDIDAELSKMKSWLLAHPRRSLTRRFITAWLNRVEKPIQIEKPKSLTKKIGQFTFTHDSPPTREICGDDWGMYFDDWKRWKDSL